MEFVHYHTGSPQDPNKAFKEKANIYAHDRLHIEGNVIPPAWLAGKVDEQRWDSSVKSRDPEAVHLPEYKGWHLHGQKITDNAAYTWNPKDSNLSPPPVYMSRGPKLHVSPNVGFKER